MEKSNGNPLPKFDLLFIFLRACPFISFRVAPCMGSLCSVLRTAPFRSAIPAAQAKRFGLFSTKIIFFLCLFFFNVQAQENKIEGKITYQNANHIYVRFSSTAGIEVGDSLHCSADGTQPPCLTVLQRSSTSCVCTSIGQQSFQLNQAIFFSKKQAKISTPPAVRSIDTASSPTSHSDSTQTLTKIDSNNAKTLLKESYLGRLSISFSGDLNQPFNSKYSGLRISNSFSINHIKNSNLSFDSYLTYRHRYGIDLLNKTVFDETQIYSLFFNYKLPYQLQLNLGRKNNIAISSIGPVDGLQIDHRWNHFSYGILLGSRPDHINFSYNINYFQWGSYISFQKPGFDRQFSVAWMQQNNHGKTDRRFAYGQWTDQLFKSLYAFASVEIDMYSKWNDTISYKPRLTSLYANLRYRINSHWTAQCSYDNRRNIILYETYNTILDQLIAQETRQGLRLNLSYRAKKYWSVNSTAFLRYQANRLVSRNVLLLFNVSNISTQKINLSFQANQLNTEFISGTIFGLRVNKDFLQGKLNGEVQYRWMNSQYSYAENNSRQDIVNMTLSIILPSKRMIFINHEANWNDYVHSQRYFITFNQRFSSKKQK